MFEPCISTKDGAVIGALSFTPGYHQVADFPSAIHGLENQLSVCREGAAHWLKDRRDTVPVLLAWAAALEALQTASEPFEATGTPEEQFEGLLRRVRGLWDAHKAAEQADEAAARFLGTPLLRR